MMTETISRLIDSPQVLTIALSAAAREELGMERVAVAGRLATIDDPVAMRHDGVVTFWADEVLALYRRFAKVPPAVVRVRSSMGGTVECDQSDLEEVFGPCPGPRTKRKINQMWKTWGRLERQQWMARKAWSESRMIEMGVDVEEARMWSANYATDRLEVDASDPF